jgi:hypothetical protein
VDIYSYPTDSWSTSHLSVARGSIAAATDGTRVAFAGGDCADSQPYLKTTVDIFSLSTRTWLTTALTVPRSSASAAIYQNKLYIAGGATVFRYSDTTKVLEIYDLNYYHWQTTNLLQLSSVPETLVLNQKLIFGNQYDYPFFNILDTRTAQQPLSAISQPYHTYAFTSISERYAFYPYIGSSQSSTLVYDAIGNQWISSAATFTYPYYDFEPAYQLQVGPYFILALGHSYSGGLSMNVDIFDLTATQDCNNNARLW